MAVIDLAAGNFLALFQNETGQSNNQSLVVSQTLNINQSVRCSDQFYNLNALLNISQNIGLIKTSNLSVSNSLILNQTGARTQYPIAINALQIKQAAVKINPQQAVSLLTIVQTVLPSRAMGNSLIINQTLVTINTLNRTNSQALSIVSTAVCYKETVNDYNTPTPVPITPTPIVLTSDTRTVTLKLPEIGDQNDIQVNRVEEQTRGGDLIIYADPVWPKIETFKYKFTNLTRDISGSLLDFLVDTLGTKITLTDYQNNQWIGIVTELPERVCRNDNNCGVYEVDLMFQIICTFAINTNSPLPSGMFGGSYNTQITTINGIGNISFNILSGNLPGGLSLSVDGIISGTP